jgi:hypothetical protein
MTIRVSGNGRVKNSKEKKVKELGVKDTNRIIY